MRDALERKLRLQLSSTDAFDEARVVYVLVEMRKLLETQGQLRQYPALRFCCDWAVHTKMDREGAQHILGLFDTAHPLLCSKEPLPSSLKREIGEFASFRNFEADLRRFLSDYGFPEDIVDRRWTEFLHSYGCVVEDCPLIVSAKRSATPVRHIKNVVLTTEEATRKIQVEDQHYTVFRLRWTCCGVDGRCGSFESYNTVP